MGKFDFQFDDGITRQLERLENFDEIVPEILGEAVPILEKHVKSEVSKHKKTGSLYESIKAGKPSKNKYGWYVAVTPTGSDENGVRNAEKLVYMEYGTSKEAATPVLTKALNDAQEEVTEKLQELFDEVVNEE